MASWTKKASWASGVCISFQGFTDEGLLAFGKSKRVIGVEGCDLHDALDRGIAIDQLLIAKVRHAAETGEVFAPLERLMPPASNV